MGNLSQEGPIAGEVLEDEDTPPDSHSYTYLALLAKAAAVLHRIPDVVDVRGSIIVANRPNACVVVGYPQLSMRT